MSSNLHLTDSLKITKLCPDTAIVFNNGVTRIDYSYCGDVFDAAMHHCDMFDFDYDDVIDFSFIHKFVSYTKDQILDAAYRGEVWPLSFGWVEVNK